MRASISIVQHPSQNMSIGSNHWAPAISIVKCVRPCQSYSLQSMSISCIDCKMCECMSLLKCRHLCRSLSNSRIDHASACIIVGCRAYAKSIMKRVSGSVISHHSEMHFCFSIKHTDNFLSWRAGIS
jgi:hypothetical protein